MLSTVLNNLSFFFQAEDVDSSIQVISTHDVSGALGLLELDTVLPMDAVSFPTIQINDLLVCH